MKKSLLIIGAAVVLFSSCKKKGTNEFEAKDTTGYTNYSGTVTKNIAGFITPAAGVSVEMRINNFGATGLYPNVTTAGTYGSEVYYATTDAMGKYSFNAKTNGLGVTGIVTYKGWQAALDTAAGSKVYDFPTQTFSQTGMVKGFDMVNNVQFVGTVLVQPTQTQNGTATVKGKIFKPVAIHSFSVGATTATTTPVSGVTVYCEYDMDPLTFTKKIYTTTTDANGNYSFSTIRTPNALGLSGFNYQAKVWVADMASTYDTIRFNGTIATGSKSGVYGTSNATASSINSGVIKNAFNLTFGGFVND